MNPFCTPLYVMAKPIGARCNLACTYCYYLDKQSLYREQDMVMSDAMLERFVREYIEAQTSPMIQFTWHGGEPLLRPLSFYQRALQWQQHYGAGRQIDNCIQTNGTLLTEEWARFLHDNQWLVGVSIDGPQEFHDEYRRNRGGRSSWAKVRRGIDLLNRFHVEWNAMAVVNDFNAAYPLDFYRFFRDELQCRYLQFTPIVETKPDAEGRPQLTDFSVTPEAWGHFLCAVFDEWVRHDVGEMFVQLFEATLANWMGLTPGVCSMARECGHAGVMEWNGDVYSCDHFVTPTHRLGNIREHSLYQLMHSPQQQRFGALKREALPASCQECPWLFACHGECPKNRIVDPDTGAIATHDLGLTPRTNYLCKGYRQFFAHVAPYMDYMKRELMEGRTLAPCPRVLLDFPTPE